MKKIIAREKKSVPWSYFKKYDVVTDAYLPSEGEGDSMATQLVTAVNKLVYKWYNDGDVFDNTMGMEGWANDLSSYANWLYKYIPQSRGILDEIGDCFNGSEYEHLLKSLADALFDMEDLEQLSSQQAQGSIYDCGGPFEFDDNNCEDLIQHDLDW